MDFVDITRKCYILRNNNTCNCVGMGERKQEHHHQQVVVLVYHQCLGGMTVQLLWGDLTSLRKNQHSMV